MAEDHEINLGKPFLDLVLRAAEIVEHVKQKTRNRKCQYGDYPDEFKCTAVVSGVDAKDNNDGQNSYCDIDRREFITEEIKKNDKYKRNIFERIESKYFLLQTHIHTVY